ncbi:MAG: hypothetical protein HY941_06355 [Gammaproteobacteria bacterium]|nr:hypothetical protein [Gammaproteobacteria bacterium]
MRAALLALCMALFILPAWSGAATPNPHSANTRLAAALATQRFVAYVPRGFSMLNGVPQPATAAGIRDDLQRLRPYFSGIVTYGLDHGQALIPELAVNAGFHALMLGVWNPKDTAELDQAIALARRYPRQVIALILGNEGLFWKRYQARDIETAAAYVRKRLPRLALGSSEPFSVYLDSADAGVLLKLDLLLPNVHPRFEPWFKPDNLEQATTFVTEVLQRLHTVTTKPVLIKETGVPSGPAEQGFTEQRQADFWTRLLARIPSGPTQSIAGFEAFDAPWKPRELQDEFGHLEASEAYWGLFRQDGSAKPALKAFGTWTGHALPTPR